MAKRTRKAAQARAKPMRRTVRTKARREPTRQSTAKRGPGRTVNASRKPVAKGGLFAGLKAYPANFAPLTPIGFVRRSAEIHPDRPAVIHGAQRFS